MNIAEYKESLKKRLSDKDHEYNTFGKETFKNAHSGEEVRMVSENWDNPLANGVSLTTTEIDKDCIYYKYIRHLPNELILEDLPIEMFGGDELLIARYYKKPYLVESIFLSSFPEETLKFLVKKYN